ncbi:hypothetical protein GCM10010197_43170 [Nocardioides luteus]|uniref:Uncharacterized protein n=1 Tax=Nocardioides luteus TaxID=1844 RepID=A0ABQ5STG5_9ACTN|nr:hypothetical protein GCM10010197_43170 [Nocardioides luteus]GLJ66839.1 hypothetical protein GCM10017579_08750 [Nocardioides luteus]
MGRVQQQAAELLLARGRESGLDAGEAERSVGLAVGVEDRGAETPAADDDQPRVDREAELAGGGDALAQSISGVVRTVGGDQVGAGQVGLAARLRQERQDRQAGRGDAEREPDALVEHVRADREGAVLAQHADGLVSAADREEGALPRLPGQTQHRRASGRGDVVAGRGGGAEQEALRAQVPGAGGVVALDQPLLLERAEQPVGGGPRDGRGRGEVGGGGALRLACGEQPQQVGAAADHAGLTSGLVRLGSRCHETYDMRRPLSGRRCLSEVDQRKIQRELALIY